MIDLYFWPTPNGKKVTILFEEIGLDYRIVPVNIGRGDQFKDDFLGISPNNRMPAIVDHAPKGGGAPVAIFESGAIMMYVAEKEGKFWSRETHAKYEVAQWVMWQMANQGPKLGECGHFRRLGDREGDQKMANQGPKLGECGHFRRLGDREGDQSYAVRSFTDEANRLYGVLNNRLADRP